MLLRGGKMAKKTQTAKKMKNKSRSLKDTLLDLGHQFDEKVQEEVKQFKDMGGVAHAGEYVAQNAVSAVSAAFTGMGLKGVADDVESTRETIIAQSRKVDERVQKEIKQFKDMGGVAHAGEYVAQNAVATVSEKKFERRIRKSEQKKKEEQEKANKFRENMNKYGAVKSAADFFNRT